VFYAEIADMQFYTSKGVAQAAAEKLCVTHGVTYVVFESVSTHASMTPIAKEVEITDEGQGMGG